ncbi:MAG: hypothetical protein QM777_25995 [Pseudorhodoferax sp.]
MGFYQNATAAWHEHARQFLEEKMRVGQMVKHVDGVHAPDGLVLKSHGLRIKLHVDVGRMADVRSDQLRADGLEKSGAGAEFDFQPVLCEQLVGQARHVPVEGFEG